MIGHQNLIQQIHHLLECCRKPQQNPAAKFVISQYQCQLERLLSFYQSSPSPGETIARYALVILFSEKCIEVLAQEKKQSGHTTQFLRKACGLSESEHFCGLLKSQIDYMHLKIFGTDLSALPLPKNLIEEAGLELRNAQHDYSISDCLPALYQAQLEKVRSISSRAALPNTSLSDFENLHLLAMLIVFLRINSDGLKSIRTQGNALQIGTRFMTGTAIAVVPYLTGVGAVVVFSSAFQWQKPATVENWLATKVNAYLNEFSPLIERCFEADDYPLTEALNFQSNPESRSNPSLMA